MASVTWLIETGVFPESSRGVVAALQARGTGWVRYRDGIPDSELPEPGVCVLFWGSLGAAYGERVAARWVPGAVGDAAQFRYSVYAPRLRERLINHAVVYARVCDLVERTDETLAPLGNPRRFFVRPDSPLKPFAGRVIETATVTRAALDHGFYYDDDTLAIVVARARAVGREWRCVVGDGRLIAVCEYGADRRQRDGEAPSAVLELASDVAQLEWQPAPIYCVDIAEVDGSLGVLELNPFSGADLYGCAPEPVVDAAGRIAQRLHAQAQ